MLKYIPSILKALKDMNLALQFFLIVIVAVLVVYFMFLKYDDTKPRISQREGWTLSIMQESGEFVEAKIVWTDGTVEMLCLSKEDCKGKVASHMIKTMQAKETKDSKEGKEKGKDK